MFLYSKDIFIINISSQFKNFNYEKISNFINIIPICNICIKGTSPENREIRG